MSDPQKNASPAETPVPFPACLRYDVVSGFLVFLIALPLCLAIAKASGFPPIGGVLTAIVGGIFASMISNSELTIKGPAAGLIAIVAGCVADMKMLDGSGEYPGYRYALAVGMVAAVIQIFFGVFKAGKLGDFFPTAAVHGLLASIGVMLIIRQFLTMLGVTAALPREAWEVVLEYPHLIPKFNLPIAIIGLTSLAILIAYQFIPFKSLKIVPVQMIVLLVAIPMGMALNLKQPTADEAAAASASPGAPAVTVIDPKHSIEMNGQTWPLPPDKFLINVPTDFTQSFVFPDFNALQHGVAWKWIAMIAIIASLESLLSAKAVDLIDPCKRKTDLNRDLLGCGVANLIAASIGGLPMISEIVRSRANTDNGAKSRFSNVFHGIFLLLFAALLPFVLKMIPTAALAALLVFTGYRLANPKEFAHMFEVGVEQFAVFVTTIVAIVCTDLLIGVMIGMVLELVVNLFRGLPITSLFSPKADIASVGDKCNITPHHAAVFSNWIPLRGKIETLGLAQKKNVTLDLSDTQLVDHTVMEKIREMQREFNTAGLHLDVVGLEDHVPVSDYATAARLRRATAMR